MNGAVEMQTGVPLLARVSQKLMGRWGVCLTYASNNQQRSQRAYMLPLVRSQICAQSYTVFANTSARGRRVA